MRKVIGTDCVGTGIAHAAESASLVFGHYPA